MKVVIQKVHKSNLNVDGELFAHINDGLLLTVGIAQTDTIDDAKLLAHKIARMRLWKDDNNKLNLSVLDKKYDILVVSNFTLLADIKSGTRPNFMNMADSDKAYNIYENFQTALVSEGVTNVCCGSFGNHMHIECVLDGPLTIVINAQDCHIF